MASSHTPRGAGGSPRRRLIGAIGGALGVAAAGTAIGIVRQQRQISRRAGEDLPFGSLHSTPLTVVADDGVPLHVEIDEGSCDHRRRAVTVHLVPGDPAAGVAVVRRWLL